MLNYSAYLALFDADQQNNELISIYVSTVWFDPLALRNGSFLQENI